MKELIFISFLLVVIIAFVVGYLTGKGAVKQKRRRTPRAPDACPYCAGKGGFTAVIGKALRCNHCDGTGQRR